MGLEEVVAGASGGKWEFCRDDRGVAVVKYEIAAAGTSPQARAMIQAEVKDMLRAALRGQLKPYVDLKHIKRNPWIFELRWNLGGDGVYPLQLWRLYFGWHSDRGPLRLALKFGSKPTGSRGRAVQDTHIDEAWERYQPWLARELAR